MDSELHRRITFNVTKQLSRHAIFPHLSIKFNLFLRTDYYNFHIKQVSGTIPLIPEPLRLPSSDHKASAHVILRHRLSYDDVQEAVGKAIGDRLRDDERSCAITLAWKEMLDSIIQINGKVKHVELNIDLKIRVKSLFIYYLVGFDSPFKVPAADWSLRLLEKYDGDGSVGAAEETCCCICLEELGGVGLGMPCLHVFHGGCIDKWLQKSRCCPLCRYEMPTATE